MKTKYNYEIVRDESGKITDIKVNGKPVKRGFMRGIRKAQNTSYWKEYREGGYVANPFGFGGETLNPLERTIAEWCKNWYYNDYSVDYSNTQAPIQAYDDMKYFLLNLNAQAYMSILD